MLPYSLILAAYSSIRVPYRELPVAYQIFPTREQLIPSVGMHDSQCGNVLFPRREQKGCPPTSLPTSSSQADIDAEQMESRGNIEVK